MKITKKISLFLLVMITAYSCDELDELTEFDIREDFSTSFNISVPDQGEGAPGSFTSEASIDITTNQEIFDNLNLIQNVGLNAMTYEISNFAGAEGAIITTASLTFGSMTIALDDINLQQSDDNDIVYVITDTNLLNALASALESNSAITLAVNGEVNATPVTFDVIVNLDITVTIDVI